MRGLLWTSNTNRPPIATLNVTTRANAKEVGDQLTERTAIPSAFAWRGAAVALMRASIRLLSRDNLDEKSGNQGENERIAERYDDRRWRDDAQAGFALRLTRSVTPMLF